MIRSYKDRKQKQNINKNKKWITTRMIGNAWMSMWKSDIMWIMRCKCWNLYYSINQLLTMNSKRKQIFVVWKWNKNLIYDNNNWTWTKIIFHFFVFGDFSFKFYFQFNLNLINCNWNFVHLKLTTSLFSDFNSYFVTKKQQVKHFN